MSVRRLRGRLRAFREDLLSWYAAWRHHLVEAPPDMPRDELTDWLNDHFGRDREEHLVIIIPSGRHDGPKIVARHRGQAPVKSDSKPYPSSSGRWKDSSPAAGCCRVSERDGNVDAAADAKVDFAYCAAGGAARGAFTSTSK